MKIINKEKNFRNLKSREKVLKLWSFSYSLYYNNIFCPPFGAGLVNEVLFITIFCKSYFYYWIFISSLSFLCNFFLKLLSLHFLSISLETIFYHLFYNNIFCLFLIFLDLMSFLFFFLFIFVFSFGYRELFLNEKGKVIIKRNLRAKGKNGYTKEELTGLVKKMERES